MIGGFYKKPYVPECYWSGISDCTSNFKHIFIANLKIDRIEFISVCDHHFDKIKNSKLFSIKKIISEENLQRHVDKIKRINDRYKFYYYIDEAVAIGLKSGYSEEKIYETFRSKISEQIIKEIIE